MNYPGFIGATNNGAAVAVDGELSLNLFPEIQTAPGTTAKSKLILRRKPGLALLQTLGDSPGRGKFSIDGRDFAVAGGSFYELLTPTTSIVRGSFASGTSPVQMCANTTQIAILADGLLYIFTLATNTFAAVTGQNGLPSYVVSLCSIDTYFLALGQNSNEFSISSPLDGTTWSGLDFGSSEEPDNAVAIAANHLYLWIFGQKETILFQDSGNSSFPFTRVAGSQIEQGLGALLSIATLDNTLFWLGKDANGAGIVYRADGLLPSRISTHAIEEAMQGYPTIADAVAMPYQENGHLFYCLHFPSAGVCQCYDVASGMWHERALWNGAAGIFTAPIERFHSYCFGMHLVLDYTSGDVYQQSQSFTTDNGASIRCLRRAPHISNEEHWLFYSYFQLDMQVGDGLAGGAAPQIMIRWSDDGGRTWSTPRQRSAGAVGQYLTRVKVNRCGRSRNRVFEISFTDPIPEVALLAAYLGVGEGAN